MLEKLFLCSMLILGFAIGCTQCKASQCPDPICSLVLTLEPGETVMVKSSDGKFSTFLDYRETKLNKKIDIKGYHKNIDDQGYHIDYHMIIWMECPTCRTYYNAGDGGCRNNYCPSKMS